MNLKEIIFNFKYYMQKLMKKINVDSAEELAFLSWKVSYMDKLLEEQREYFLNELDKLASSFRIDGELENNENEL